MITNINAFCVLLAQQQPMVEDPKAQMIKSFLMMGGIMVVFWFLMIQPQRKKAKELASLLDTLKAGDKIVTNSGILGVVLSIKDKTVTLRSAETKLEILKSAVAEVTDRGETTEVKS